MSPRASGDGGTYKVRPDHRSGSRGLPARGVDPTMYASSDGGGLRATGLRSPTPRHRLQAGDGSTLPHTAMLKPRRWARSAGGVWRSRPSGGRSRRLGGVRPRSVPVPAPPYSQAKSPRRGSMPEPFHKGRSSAAEEASPVTPRPALLLPAACLALVALGVGASVGGTTISAIAACQPPRRARRLRRLRRRPRSPANPPAASSFSSTALTTLTSWPGGSSHWRTRRSGVGKTTTAINLRLPRRGR